MTATIPTQGQLERTLSQRIQGLYKDQLGHRPSKVTCRLLGEKIIIVIEDSITQPEQILAQEGQMHLAKEVRSELDDAIQPQLKTLVEEIVKVDVVDLLSDATLETGRSGAIVVLAECPTVRSSASAQRLKARTAV